jgi:preprotein translocase subunit SecG
MENVLLVAYLLIVLALIAVILLQRSEGGGLGMGGNAGGLMTVRGSANLLTRTTGILAALFFATAIGLTILASTPTGAQPSTVLDALSQLQGDTTLPLTSTEAPASSEAAAADPGLALPITPAAPSDAAQESAAGSSAPAQ